MNKIRFYNLIINKDNKEYLVKVNELEKQYPLYLTFIKHLNLSAFCRHYFGEPRDFKEIMKSSEFDEITAISPF